MSQISDDELHILIERTVERTLQSMISAPRPEVVQKPAAASAQSAAANTTVAKKVAVGSDHGGFEMKEALKVELVALGYEVIDCGTSNKEAVDYPDFAHAVAVRVAEGSAWRGIVVDGAGIGSCMAANKVPGVRAAMCYDYASASNSREHNDANVLTLGAGLIGLNQAKLIVKTWLGTEFGGGRHQKRIDKIIAIEKQYMKDRK